MSWRVVVISSNAKVDYKMDYLVVRTLDETRRVHISEIAVLMLESTAVSLTAYAVCELLAHKVKVIFCDKQRNPFAEVLPTFGSHFGMEFSRALPCPVNAALNYGYGLILSAINREICAAGYLTQLFTALLRQAQETMAEETFRLSAQLQEYLGKLAALADYPVAYEQSENLLPLLKAMEFRVDLEDLPPHETLYEYLSLLDRLLKDQCFVLVQAKTYFSEQELLQLYSMAQYRKWNLLLLEAHAAPRRLDGEVHRLYDADLCELLDP